nr:unnamed protein product [Digitaria exilis]
MRGVARERGKGDVRLLKVARVRVRGAEATSAASSPIQALTRQSSSATSARQALARPPSPASSPHQDGAAVSGGLEFRREERVTDRGQGD